MAQWPSVTKVRRFLASWPFYAALSVFSAVAVAATVPQAVGHGGAGVWVTVAFYALATTGWAGLALYISQHTRPSAAQIKKQ